MNNHGDEPRDEREPVQSVNKNRALLIFVLVVLIMTSSILTLMENNTQTIKFNEYVSLYNETVKDITEQAMTGLSLTKGYAEGYSEVWSNAIKTAEMDIDFEKIKESTAKDNVLVEMAQAKDRIDEKMKKLKNHPKECKEAYDTLQALYDKYCSIYVQAQTVNQVSSDFSMTLENIKSSKPAEKH
ncbi:hypothetical protein GJ688_18915 [Heliobacillus mobilis]|uniref:Uncharacterized protein n=1 Tax=Heliobacterium mobile TaxID=28064 RepID=A0A6I3SPP1_HELMO|nr:hypothetical protein [Heliobacterium mobile]MTV50991.1 hypothetical protein [Heliobacterium mobile]